MSRTITPNECRAIQFLAADGWTTNELQLVFEAHSETIVRHRNGDCSCPSLESPSPWPELSGDEILSARARANMTQRELAEAVGVASQTVRDWEADRYDPNPSNRRQICRVLGIQPTTAGEGVMVDG